MYSGWNNFRVSNSGQSRSFWVEYPFKIALSLVYNMVFLAGWVKHQTSSYGFRLLNFFISPRDDTLM